MKMKISFLPILLLKDYLMSNPLGLKQQLLKLKNLKKTMMHSSMVKMMIQILLILQGEVVVERTKLIA
jgi:hypothetical protein